MNIFKTTADGKHASHLGTPVERTGREAGSHLRFLSILLHWTPSGPSSETSTDPVLQCKTETALTCIQETLFRKRNQSHGVLPLGQRALT